MSADLRSRWLLIMGPYRSDDPVVELGRLLEETTMIGAGIPDGWRPATTVELADWEAASSMRAHAQLLFEFGYPDPFEMYVFERGQVKAAGRAPRWAEADRLGLGLFEMTHRALFGIRWGEDPGAGWEVWERPPGYHG